MHLMALKIKLVPDSWQLTWEATCVINKLSENIYDGFYSSRKYPTTELCFNYVNYKYMLLYHLISPDKDVSGDQNLQNQYY